MLLACYLDKHQICKRGRQEEFIACLHSFPSEQGTSRTAPKGSGLVQLDEALVVLQGNTRSHARACGTPVNLSQEGRNMAEFFQTFKKRQMLASHPTPAPSHMNADNWAVLFWPMALSEDKKYQGNSVDSGRSEGTKLIQYF